MGDEYIEMYAADQRVRANWWWRGFRQGANFQSRLYEMYVNGELSQPPFDWATYFYGPWTKKLYEYDAEKAVVQHCVQVMKILQRDGCTEAEVAERTTGFLEGLALRKKMLGYGD